jgi:4'-phosphopantetheinyl transferase
MEIKLPEARIVLSHNNYLVAVSQLVSEEDAESAYQNNWIPGKKAGSLHRRQELVTVKALLEFAMNCPVKYNYNEKGKPVLEHGSELISISHSRHHCAVIISKKGIPGIDIENFSDRIFRIADRFLNDEETLWVKNHETSLHKHFLIWCAKETLYKISPHKPDFKLHLSVKPGELDKTGFISCTDQLSGQTEIILHYIIEPEYMLVFGSGCD